MKRYLVIVALCVVMLAAVAPVRAAAPSVSVINNVLAESIVKGPKGVRINGAIVKFKAGTAANFQSLTQLLIAEPGMYMVRLEIVGPDAKLRAYDGLMVDAGTANWTHSQLTHWRAVSFDTAGVYRFVVRVNSRVIGDYPLPVDN